ncbi:hypothetical protein [Escherichia phage FL37]
MLIPKGRLERVFPFCVLYPVINKVASLYSIGSENRYTQQRQEDAEHRWVASLNPVAMICY